MKIFRAWAVLATMCLALGFAVPAMAQSASPAGLWQAGEGAGKSVVGISDANDTVTGKVEWADAKTRESVCVNCVGEPKPKLLGLPILQLKPDAAKAGQWVGHLLDPKSGKIYNVIAFLADNGNALNLDVSVGLFSKNVHWHRLPTSALSIYPADQVAVGAA